MLPPDYDDYEPFPLDDEPGGRPPDPAPEPRPAPKKRRTTKRNTKKSSGGGGRLAPFVLVSLVTLVLLFWAMRSCGDDDREYAMIAEEQARQTYLDSVARAEEQARSDAEAQARAEALLRAQTTPPLGDSVLYSRPPEVVVERRTVLYSTINGLNVRSGPDLSNGIIARLPLYAEVLFAGAVTDSLYEINLGEITPRAPWVQVELADGKVGWVYGAGVSYYKYQLQGVIN